jgi:hypothetical protein
LRYTKKFMYLFTLLTALIKQPSVTTQSDFLKIAALILSAAAAGQLTKKMLRKYQRKLLWAGLKLKAKSFFKQKKESISSKKLLIILLAVLLFILLALTAGILAAFIIVIMALLIWLILDKYILVD